LQRLRPDLHNDRDFLTLLVRAATHEGGRVGHGDTRMPRFVIPILCFLALLLPAPPLATCQAMMQEATATDAAAQAPLQNPKPAPPVLTLEEMLLNGGVFLWAILALGFLALVLSLYLLFALTLRREVPKALIKRVRKQVEDGDVRGAYEMCRERDEFLANVFRAGLKHAGKDRFVIQEAMESEGERGATALWQRISWLNSIATMAPLLGLLGTVWGMMQAFRSIAFDDAQARGMAMAYAVSEAMVTTAAGLVLAIPCLAVYYLLRGRVIRIVAEVEAQASEMVELIASGGR